jgi:hypothetical protein
MGRPSFHVQYLVYCTSIDYLDRNRPHRNSILSGVDFSFQAAPNTEFPFEPEEFWLFARFYSLRDGAGSTPSLTVTCVWLDSPGGQEVEVWHRVLGPVRFLQPFEVLDRSWTFRNFADDVRYPFLGVGRYEFRLWHSTRK